jgi:hypothetical protein
MRPPTTRQVRCSPLATPPHGAAAAGVRSADRDGGKPSIECGTMLTKSLSSCAHAVAAISMPIVCWLLLSSGRSKSSARRPAVCPAEEQALRSGVPWLRVNLAINHQITQSPDSVTPPDPPSAAPAAPGETASTEPGSRTVPAAADNRFAPAFRRRPGRLSLRPTAGCRCLREGSRSKRGRAEPSFALRVLESLRRSSTARSSTSR